MIPPGAQNINEVTQRSWFIPDDGLKFLRYRIGWKEQTGKQEQTGELVGKRLGRARRGPLRGTHTPEGLAQAPGRQGHRGGGGTSLGCLNTSTLGPASAPPPGVWDKVLG